MKFIEINGQYWNVNCIASFAFTESSEKPKMTSMLPGGGFSPTPVQSFDLIPAKLELTFVSGLGKTPSLLKGEDAERVYSALLSCNV